MKILAFDTAMAGCSAAVLDTQTGVATAESLSMLRGQAEELVPLIQKVMDRAKAEFSDLDRIGVTTGPGAFTGLRIGLSTARALALALDISVAGVMTIDVIARQYLLKNRPEGILVVLLETKREDFYIRIGDEAPEALSADEIEARLKGRAATFIGDALGRFDRRDKNWRFVEGYELPDPVVLAQLAAAQATPAPAEPVYLRAADVSLSKKPRRILQD